MACVTIIFGDQRASTPCIRIPVTLYHERCASSLTYLGIPRVIGSFDGKTVVQVYAGANGDHPVKLLKGFKKVNVPAGKEIEETMTVYKDDLKFYDEKAGEWYLENEYTFYVGQDSADAMNNKLTVSV